MKLDLSTPTKPERVPNHLLLYGPPKIGKNSAVALLPGHFVMNLDNGCRYLETFASPHLTTPEEVEEFLDAFHDLSEKPKFLVVDTVDKLQEVAFARAIAAYNVKFKKALTNKDDLLALDHGAGYGWLRSSFDYYLNELFLLDVPIIWLAHVRYRHLNDSTAEKAEKRMLGNKPRELSLMGLICDKICADMCLIGFMFRDGDALKIDTTPSESTGIGTRLKHLDSRQFTLSVKNKAGEIEHGGGWQEIFGSLVTTETAKKKAKK